MPANLSKPYIFNFVTLFPELIEPYFRASILARAREAKLIETRFFNPRDASTHPHKKVDDYAIGGGAGLVICPQPMFDTLEPLRDSHIVFVAPAGKPFRQQDARRLARLDRELTIVCGRYEGIDERVFERYANEIFSTGDYVLTGGELPALCIADAISRNISGVINNESLECESFENSLLEAPAFARPVEYLHDFSATKQSGDLLAKNENNYQNYSQNLSQNKNFRAIFTFVKGNHARIRAFKNQLSLCKSKFHRPDLLAAHHFLRNNNEK